MALWALQRLSRDKFNRHTLRKREKPDWVSLSLFCYTLLMLTTPYPKTSYRFCYKVVAENKENCYGLVAEININCYELVAEITKNCYELVAEINKNCYEFVAKTSLKGLKLPLGLCAWWALKSSITANIMRRYLFLNSASFSTSLNSTATCSGGL